MSQCRQQKFWAVCLKFVCTDWSKVLVWELFRKRPTQSIYAHAFRWSHRRLGAQNPLPPSSFCLLFLKSMNLREERWVTELEINSYFQDSDHLWPLNHPTLIWVQGFYFDQSSRRVSGLQELDPKVIDEAFAWVLSMFFSATEEGVRANFCWLFTFQKGETSNYHCCDCLWHRSEVPENFYSSDSAQVWR